MSPDYVPDFSAFVLPYVKWFQDDFIGGVRGMRAHEIGIYTALLMEMYARGRALDQSEDRLARLCGADKRTFKRTLDMLIEDGKIVRLNIGLWNERCENAFRERAKMQEQQSSAGRASAEKRNKNNNPIQRSLNGRSAVVQPISEAQIEDKKYTPSGAAKRLQDETAKDQPQTLEAKVYSFGKLVLGKSAGGVITKLKKHHRGDLSAVMTTLQLASEKASPSEWVGGVLRGTKDAEWEAREAEIYAGVQ